MSLEVRFYTLSCNLEKNNFFTENLCLFFLGTAKCTYLYCSKFSLLEFGLTARYAYHLWKWLDLFLHGLCLWWELLCCSFVKLREQLKTEMQYHGQLYRYAGSQITFVSIIFKNCILNFGSDNFKWIKIACSCCFTILVFYYTSTQL